MEDEPENAEEAEETDAEEEEDEQDFELTPAEELDEGVQMEIEYRPEEFECSECQALMGEPWYIQKRNGKLFVLGPFQTDNPEEELVEVDLKPGLLVLKSPRVYNSTLMIGLKISEEVENLIKST